MLFTRGPLMRLLLALWCAFGAYVFTADVCVYYEDYTNDILTVLDDSASVDANAHAFAEIRSPHLSAAVPGALRNPLCYASQADRPAKCTMKPRRLSHFEYCSRDMVRSIMLQFHPRDLQYLYFL